jgi:hypothetical protein
MARSIGIWVTLTVLTCRGSRPSPPGLFLADTGLLSLQDEPTAQTARMHAKAIMLRARKDNPALKLFRIKTNNMINNQAPLLYYKQVE